MFTNHVEYDEPDDGEEIFGCTNNGIKWQLKKLQDNGSIRRVGPLNGGHWEIIETL